MIGPIQRPLSGMPPKADFQQGRRAGMVNPESPAGELRADGKKVLTLNSSIRYCALRPAPQLQHAGKLWLVRELPKNRRRTEVPVSFSGSAGAVGRHNNNSK
jgi:hypothetical protein